MSLGINYAFTLQVPTFKKVKFNGHYVAYGSLDYDSQKAYLEILLESAGVIYSDITFEKHKDGRLHCHGVIPDVCLGIVERDQADICKLLGLRQKQYNQVFNFLPIHNNVGWGAYMYKDQPKEEDIEGEDLLRFEKYGF